MHQNVNTLNSISNKKVYMTNTKLNNAIIGITSITTFSNLKNGQKFVYHDREYEKFNDNLAFSCWSGDKTRLWTFDNYSEVELKSTYGPTTVKIFKL